MSITMSRADPGELQRLPGLFRRWELGQIIESGEDYHIEDAGKAADGTALFAVYRREPVHLGDGLHRGCHRSDAEGV